MHQASASSTPAPGRLDQLQPDLQHPRQAGDPRADRELPADRRPSRTRRCRSSVTCSTFQGAGADDDSLDEAPTEGTLLIQTSSLDPLQLTVVDRIAAQAVDRLPRSRASSSSARTAPGSSTRVAGRRNEARSDSLHCRRSRSRCAAPFAAAAAATRPRPSSATARTSSSRPSTAHRHVARATDRRRRRRGRRLGHQHGRRRADARSTRRPTRQSASRSRPTTRPTPSTSRSARSGWPRSRRTRSSASTRRPRKVIDRTKVDNRPFGLAARLRLMWVTSIRNETRQPDRPRDRRSASASPIKIERPAVQGRRRASATSGSRTSATATL